MYKLLVDNPQGIQEIIEVGEGGGYYDQTKVLWDERVDGRLPDITPGGLVRQGDELVVDRDKQASQVATSFSAAKVNRLQEIDDRTSALIQNGFTFDNNDFSLSIEAQINFSTWGTHASRLSYPFVVSTEDGTYSVADAATMVNLSKAALDAIKSSIDNGNTLKAQIRSAANQTALDAIVDNR